MRRSSIAAGLPSLLLLALAGGCRKGQAQQASNFIPLTPPVDGTNGCNGSDVPFSGGPTLDPVSLSTLQIGPASQIAADADEELLFVTGAGATLVELDLTGGPVPSERVLVSSGTVDALLGSVGISVPAELSGVAVLDQTNLAVIEHASNTILLVSRLVPDDVSFLVGLPEQTGGFSDGLGAQVRFSFDEPTSLVPTADGLLLVADSGNDAIRLITLGAFPQVVTVAGTGAPGFQDGSLRQTLFDTPVGLSVACAGQLLVTESGASGLGGNRLRSLSIGSQSFFGGFSGMAATLAGDGTDATVQGTGSGAALAGPQSLAGTSEGTLYWVDGTTGILRRMDGMTAEVDCPLFPDCSAAGGLLSAGGNHALALSSSGTLFVVDSASATLFRVTP